jgi:small-conductance mechanosensitive channel
MKKLLAGILGFLFLITPVLAANPIEAFASNLKGAGFILVLLWLLTLAIVYGVLAHVNIPKSMTARGVISIAIAFLVLLAAAGKPAEAAFIQNLVTAAVLIAFGMLIVLIFLEMVGQRGIFEKHPRFFAGAIILLVILIFIGAGGLGIINIPSISISDPILAILFFLVVMGVAVWVMFRETGGKV